MKKLSRFFGGTLTGFVNGLLGSGGGMIAVPYLRSQQLPTKKCHATSIAVIAPLCALSAGIYLYNGQVTIADALPYLPGSLIGALIGARLIKQFSPVWLKRAFGGFAIWAGIRLLLK